MIKFGEFEMQDYTLKDFNLKGEIKTITQKQIFVDKNLKQITEAKKSRKSQVILELVFSINGNLINKEETTTILENFTSIDYNSNFRFEYNELNQLVKYFDCKSHGYLEFVYRDNKIIEVNNIKDDSQITLKFEFNYNSDGTISSIIRDDKKLNQGGSMYYENVYRYLNDKHLRIETHNRHHKISSYKEYEFNSKKSPTKITKVGAFNQRFIDFFEYNSNNDLILENGLVYEYEYDNYGNWIKRLEYEKLYGLYQLFRFRRKRPSSITSRQIEYFKQE